MNGTKLTLIMTPREREGTRSKLLQDNGSRRERETENQSLRRHDALLATSVKFSRRRIRMTDTQTVTDLHRHFAARRELVYQAFTDEDQLAAWFGPIGFWVLRDSVSVDTRIGGHRRMTMVTYNGLLSWSIYATFTEVIENQLLVGYEDVTGIPAFKGIDRFPFNYEFIDEGGGTRLELRQGPYSIEMEALAREGWLQSFTKLDALLAGQ